MDTAASMLMSPLTQPSNSLTNEEDQSPRPSSSRYRKRKSDGTAAAIMEVAQAMKQRVTAASEESLKDKECQKFTLMMTKVNALADAERLVAQVRDAIRAIETAPFQTDTDIDDLNRLKSQFKKYQEIAERISNET